MYDIAREFSMVQSIAMRYEDLWWSWGIVMSMLYNSFAERSNQSTCSVAADDVTPLIVRSSLHVGRSHLFGHAVPSSEVQQ